MSSGSATACRSGSRVKSSPGWAIASPGAYDSWTWQALLDLSRGSARAPTVALPAHSTLRPGPSEIRPVLRGVSAGDIVHTELYVDGVLRAEADGPAVVWSSADRFAGGRVQIAVYTRDRHVWPSEVATVKAGD